MDMHVLLSIVIGTIIVSLLSLIGISVLWVKDKILSKILIYLVCLSIGALIGGAFIHLIPEALSTLNYTNVFAFVIIGFLLFFVIERLFHWRHCHEKKCKIHSFAYMNLLGDGIHNFIDGLIIAASFIADSSLGLASILAIATHEIPQEISDFGVLVYAGITKKKALLFNFLTALTAILGGIIGYFLFSYIYISLGYLLSFAAGGFIYIAASDLIPELKQEKGLLKPLLHILVIIIGIILMYLLKG
jgi:zinc and cadmium transporter